MKNTDEKPSPDTKLDAQEKLMRAAQMFSIAFREDRVWGDDTKRLEYTVQEWRKLALAAMEYAQTNSKEEKK